MALKLITVPATEPVTLAEAKLQCKVDVADDDTLITAYIRAAREMAEHRTARSLITQTWELALDAFPDSEIELFNPPVQSITSIKYIDTSGVEQTLNSANYALDSYGIKQWVLPVYGYSWPATLATSNAVKIRYVSGYADVPSGIKSWMLLTIGTLYQNRENVIEMRTTAIPDRFYDSLLDAYRVWSM